MWDFYEYNPNAKLPFNKIGPFYYPDNITEYEITLAKKIEKEKNKKRQTEKYLSFLEQHACKLSDKLSLELNLPKKTINAACFLSLIPFALCQEIVFTNKILFMDMFFFSIEYAFESQKGQLSDGETDDLRYLITKFSREMLGVWPWDFEHLWFNRQYAFEKICSYYGTEKCVEKCTLFMQYSFSYNKPFDYLVTDDHCCVFETFDDDNVVPFPLIDVFDQTMLAMSCNNSFLAFQNGLHSFMR
jgi:hypothetical protein